MGKNCFSFWAGWWFGTCFPYIGNFIIPTYPNWLSYFSEGWVNHQPVGICVEFVICVARFPWWPPKCSEPVTCEGPNVPAYVKWCPIQIVSRRKYFDCLVKWVKWNEAKWNGMDHGMKWAGESSDKIEISLGKRGTIWGLSGKNWKIRYGISMANQKLLDGFSKLDDQLISWFLDGGTVCEEMYVLISVA